MKEKFINRLKKLYSIKNDGRIRNIVFLKVKNWNEYTETIVKITS